MHRLSVCSSTMYVVVLVGWFAHFHILTHALGKAALSFVVLHEGISDVLSVLYKVYKLPILFLIYSSIVGFQLTLSVFRLLNPIDICVRAHNMDQRLRGNLFEFHLYSISVGRFKFLLTSQERSAWICF